MTRFVLVLGLGLLAGQGLLAQSPPRLVPAAGVARDAAGNLQSGAASVTFAIYAAQEGGDPLWKETQSLTLDASGQYSTLLGLTANEGLPRELFSEGAARWLAVSVNGGPEGRRTFWASVPYALKAADAETVGGLPLEAFMLNGAYRNGADAPSVMPRADRDGMPPDAPTIEDPDRPADQVIPDDLIVQGSVCSGIDCVNNEDFGFDTVRLKENNTRLQFDDTSVGAFPSNNWQIRANSSASGGANFLGIVDQGATGTSETGTIVFQVEAGAPANALFVDNTGRIGVRTATPATEIHSADTDTPALRLEQTAAGGFSPQSWDVAGNETNFFVRDVTNGSRLPFKILPGAPHNALVVAASGNIGSGTTSPGGSFELQKTGADVTLLLSNTSGSRWEMKNNTATGRLTFGPVGGNVPIKVGATAAENLFRVGILNDSTVDVNGDLVLASTSPTKWELKNNAATGRLTFGTTGGPVPMKFGPAAVENLLRVGILNNNTVDINGNLVVTGTCCAPDYVFEPDYPLRSLSELESYVKDNKHLPGVPSAAEISNAGINMREMNYALLEKIEELVLYTLQQQKAIDDLQERLRKLEADNRQQ